MHIVVLMKQVPDTASKIELKQQGGKSVVNYDAITFVINPYCEFAVEEALRIRERLGGEGTITCVGLGPERAEEALRTALAMGADQAVLVRDEGVNTDDNLVVARVLAAAVKPLKPDLVFCGMEAADDEAGITSQMVAEFLDLPQVTVVTRVEVDVDRKGVIVTREIEGGKEIVAAPLPCVLTAQVGLNEARYPSFAGIMKAKRKPLEVKSAADLGLSPADLAGQVELVDMSPPPPRLAGKILTGEPADAVRELVRLLREEAKVI